ncbi:uncharacterized protein G2W53_031926 [Senna tora]|uniref:Uncharacterized protein n=1 Tax=Senna tora TaxID=362788 RepID=A0A834W5V7_9FABA|nr:uncharacterized protein G2W53_031926 [Senna tora]
MRQIAPPEVDKNEQAIMPETATIKEYREKAAPNELVKAKPIE